jgi:hypothetical protein
VELSLRDSGAVNIQLNALPTSVGTVINMGIDNAPNLVSKSQELNNSPLVSKLQNLTGKQDNNFKAAEDKIKHLVKQFDQVIDDLAKEIRLDIKDVKLGKDLTEEDADKMLIIHAESTIEELNEWSLAKKRSKVVKILEEMKPDCEEYALATKTRIASLKDKLVRTVKAEVLEKIDKVVAVKLEENDKDVAQKRLDLDNTAEYQKEKQALEEAKAEKVIREVFKKRASRRKSAYNAVALAAVSAVADSNVIKTRENIISTFDNAVTLANVAKTRLLQDGRDPVKNSEHYKEMEEITLEGLAKKEYQLQDTSVGSDKVKPLLEASQEGLKLQQSERQSVS